MDSGKIKKIISVFMCGIFVISFCGCSENNQYSGFAMDSPFSLSVYSSKKNSDDVFNEISSTASASEVLLSRFDKNSLTYKLNNRIDVNFSDTKTLADIFIKVRTVSSLTNGRYSLVCGALTSLWGIGTDEINVPSEDEIKNALSFCGDDKIKLSESGLSFINDTASLDFGSVGKGYLCDKAKTVFEDTETNGAVASFGGSVIVYGKKPSGKWKVSIRSPYSQNETAGTLTLDGTNFISTSGGYERFFEKDGKTYHHIFDLSSGMPSNSGLSSATVICDSGVLSDALSTACFILGKDDGITLLRNFPGAKAVFIDENRNIFTYDINDGFTVSNGFVLRENYNG